jgi:long-subunit acyl-CoA synthetase (AMP-forming)
MKQHLPDDVEVTVLEDLLTEKRTSFCVPYDAEEDPVVAVFYTSGSTGEPKRVELRQRNAIITV